MDSNPIFFTRIGSGSVFFSEIESGSVFSRIGSWSVFFARIGSGYNPGHLHPDPTPRIKVRLGTPDGVKVEFKCVSFFLCKGSKYGIVKIDWIEAVGRS